MAVVIIGAGGHGKVVADILQLLNIAVVGFLDDDPTLWNTTVFRLPVLGGADRYEQLPVDGAAIAIGSNHARKAIGERFTNIQWMSAIHPSAIIAPSASLGRGITIAPQSVIAPDTNVGNMVIVNTGATIDHDCIISNYAHIAPGAHIAGNVTIGTGALVGVGASIIPGMSVGDWSIIGAGATVVTPIPSNVIAKGTPARW